MDAGASFKIFKVDEKAMIGNRCNQIPHHAQDIKRDRNDGIKS